MMFRPWRPDPEEVFLAKLQREVADDIFEGMPFDKAMAVGERQMIDRAIRRAWERFKKELADLPAPGPQRWTAHIPHQDWMTLQLDERSRLGARPFQNVVLVEGVGEPPAIVSQWAFVR